jgi:hypothetical protein
MVADIILNRKFQQLRLYKTYYVHNTQTTRRNLFYFLTSKFSSLQHTFYISPEAANSRHQRYPKEIHATWWLNPSSLSLTS